MKRISAVTQTVLLLLTTSVSLTARADEYGQGFDRFSDAMRGASISCRTQSAPTSATADKACDNGDLVLKDIEVSSEDFKKLELIAFDQAQIWGDTILEGDYIADGKTQLDRVEAVMTGTTLTGYRITYSEKAWFTGVCGAGHGAPESELSRCQVGRISEASYVSPDFASWLRDDEAYAEFK